MSEDEQVRGAKPLEEQDEVAAHRLAANEEPGDEVVKSENDDDDVEAHRLA